MILHKEGSKKHRFICELGCLIIITHQSQIAEHFQEHLSKIKNYIKYRENDSDKIKIEVYHEIKIHIESSATKNQ